MKSHSDHNRTPESISVTAGNIKAPLWAGLACIVEGLICGERERERDRTRYRAGNRSKEWRSLSAVPESLEE